MELGIDYASKTDEALQKYRNKYNYGNAWNSTVNDESIFKGNSDSTNTCTDGKDDGKIGFWSATWSMVKGAAKGVWNGIKGCFTDSEGKFSIGKTLLTVGVGALCVAVPAVGLAACAIGGVMGGSKIIKGIVNASNATTDAAKKDAFENIGDGTLTVASSLVGFKASYGAVKATSTAGIDDALKGLDNVDDALNQVDDISNMIKANGLDNVDDTLNGLDNVDDAIKAAAKLKAKGKASAWDQLDDTATNLDKLKAVGKDSWSSTKNQGLKIKEMAKAEYNIAKKAKAEKDISRYDEKLRDAQKKAIEKHEKFDNPEETKDLIKKRQKADTRLDEANDALSQNKYGTKADELYNAHKAKVAKKQATKQQLDDAIAQRNNAQSSVDKQQASLDKANKTLDDLCSAGDTRSASRGKGSAIKDAKKAVKKNEGKLKNAEEALKNKESEVSRLEKAVADQTFKGRIRKTKQTIKDYIYGDHAEQINKKQEFLSSLDRKNTSYKATVKSLKTMKREAYKDFIFTIPEKYQNIIQALHDENKTYNQVVQEFGWRDTAETLTMIQGFMKTSSSEI